MSNTPKLDKLTAEFNPTCKLMVAECLKKLARDLDSWTGRCDDAKRIPDVIDEAAKKLKAKAEAEE